MADFTGMWKLAKQEYKDSTGVWVEREWMKNGTGYIIYDGKGHMAVHITDEGYQDIDVTPLINHDSLTYEQQQFYIDLLAGGNYVYVANCRILDGKNIIEHAIVSHGRPHQWNEVFKRSFEFRADTLILSTLEGELEVRLLWIKQ